MTCHHLRELCLPVLDIHWFVGGCFFYFIATVISSYHYQHYQIQAEYSTLVQMHQIKLLAIQTLYCRRRDQSCENCNLIFGLLLPHVVPCLIFFFFFVLLFNAVSHTGLKTTNYLKKVFTLQTNQIMFQTATTSFGQMKFWVCWSRPLSMETFTPVVLVRTKLKSPKVQTKRGRRESGLSILVRPTVILCVM